MTANKKAKVSHAQELTNILERSLAATTPQPALVSEQAPPSAASTPYPTAPAKQPANIIATPAVQPKREGKGQRRFHPSVSMYERDMAIADTLIDAIRRATHTRPSFSDAVRVALRLCSTENGDAIAAAYASIRKDDGRMSDRALAS